MTDGKKETTRKNKDDFAESFARRLKEESQRKKLSGKALAKAAGTAGSTISRYFGGERRPDALFALARLAAALEVSADYLLGLTNNPFTKGSLPEEVRSLLTLYRRADEEDRRVVWTVLEKYARLSR